MDDDETLTAYHEAGHAVMAYALGGVVDSMQIGGAADDWLPERFGDCRIRWGRVDANSNWQRQRELLTIMAGPVAEMIYRGVDPLVDLAGPSQHDWQRAWLLAGSFIPNQARRMQFLHELNRQLAVHIQSEPCWPAIAAVADELAAHEYLEAEQVQHTLSFWFR